MTGPAFGVTTIAVAFGHRRCSSRRSPADTGAGAATPSAASPTAPTWTGSPVAAVVHGAPQILGRHDPDPKHSGLLVGRDVQSRQQVWLPKESTILVLAPPRSGKTSGTVAPAVVDHHGPVVATGVRRDIMLWTHPWRATTGAPMWLCEPMIPPGTALPAGVELVRWSPVDGL